MNSLSHVNVKTDSEKMLKEFMKWIKKISEDSVWKINVDVEPPDALPTVAIQFGKMKEEVSGKFLKWLCETEEHAKNLLKGIQKLKITKNKVEIEIKYKPPHWEERIERITIEKSKQNRLNKRPALKRSA